MSSPENNNSTQINLQDFNPRNFHNKFSQTPEGKKLKEHTRYIHFQGELTNENWQKILGYDVNNLEHAQLTYGITYLFIKEMNASSEFFNPEEKKILLLTSIIHDYPEGFTEKGDVPYNIKTTKDDENEFKFIEPIITQALGQKDLFLSNKIINILDGKEPKLGQAFNAIEKIGYVRTALKAWEKSKITNEPTSLNLIWLTTDVFSNSITKLIEYSSIYSPINNFLKNKQNLISEAFANMPTSIFDKYNSTEEKELRINKVNKALTQWNVWINQ